MLAFVLLGGVAMIWTTLCLVRPSRRLEGVLLGSAGLVAGGLAALVVLVPDLLRGKGLDAIPHEPVFEWFVAAFGAAVLGARVLLAVRGRIPGALGAVPDPEAAAEPERHDPGAPLAPVIPFRGPGSAPRSPAEAEPPDVHPPEAGRRDA